MPSAQSTMMMRNNIQSQTHQFYPPQSGYQSQVRHDYQNSKFLFNNRYNNNSDETLSMNQHQQKRPTAAAAASTHNQQQSQNVSSEASAMDQSSSSTSQLYDVDHLATFVIESKHGLLKAEDGMRRLRYMEKSEGIWPMECRMMLDKRNVYIIEKQTNREIEILPISMIHEPTSVRSDDRKDVYNNIILFTVAEDKKKIGSASSSTSSSSTAEMFIFQCVNSNASDIVDEILRAKNIPSNGVNNKRIASAASSASTSNHMHQSEINNNYITTEMQQHQQQQHQPFPRQFQASQQNYTPFSESIDQDVQILNHCFDDIERFVTRLQSSSDSNKELERRRKNRKSGKRQIGDGMLSMRAQMPPQEHFYDIFQKFKLSFNLLAKLKAHIHDPNAPELVHFLFTPLSLIINATKDLQQMRGLTKTVWSPLLTRAAKELLLNCLTSKEQDLWQSLGEAWTITKEEARMQQHFHYIEPYNPIFYDGWAPTLEQVDTRSEISRLGVISAQQQTAHQAAALANQRRMQQQQQQSSALSNYSNQMQQQQQVLTSRSQKTNMMPVSQQQQQISVDANDGADDEVRRWALNLYYKGAKICEVTNDRNGKNDKELSVRAGEFVEVLDDRRNWWRVRNTSGLIGHVPNTLLKPFEAPNSPHLTYQHQQQQQQFDTIEKNNQTNGEQYHQTQEHISPNDSLPTHHLKLNSNNSNNNNSNANLNSQREDDSIPTTVKLLPSQIVQANKGTASSPQISNDPQISSQRNLSKSALNSNVSFGQKEETPRSGNHNSSNEHHSNEISARIDLPYMNHSGAISTPHASSSLLKASNFHSNDNQMFSPNNNEINSSKIPPAPQIMPMFNMNKTDSTSSLKPSSQTSISMNSSPSNPHDNFTINSPAISEISPRSRESDNNNNNRNYTTNNASHNQVIDESEIVPLRESLHEELLKRMTIGRNKQFKENTRKKLVQYITPTSTPEDVRNFLESKGFSPRTVFTFGELTGKQLFTLIKEDFEKYCGKDEGSRLDSQIRVQKSICGYKARTENELNEILKKRKEKTEIDAQNTTQQQQTTITIVSNEEHADR